MRKVGLLFLLAIMMAACRSLPEDLPLPLTTAVATAVPTAAAVSAVTPQATAVAPAHSPVDIYLPLVSASEPTATLTPFPTANATPTSTPPAFPVYEGLPFQRRGLGVQVHIHQEEMADLMGHLRALGVGWVKVQVSWKLYQPGPGAYTQDRFMELDRLVHQANANGIAVLLSVSKAPEWSRPTTEQDGPPTDFGLFQAFMRTIAARYQGDVAAYELWNEPNLQREWTGVPLSAADLVALIREGATGVRASDPEAIIVSAAPATTGINDGRVAIDDRVFLRGMLAAGVAEGVDAVGVHPYGWANPPDTTAAAPDTAVPSHNDHPSFFFKDTVADYRTLLTAYGADNPLWITEFGWASFDGLGVPPPLGAEFMADVSEWQQAVYILRAFEMAQAWDGVGPMILWNLNFGRLLGTQFAMSGYGLLRPDGSPRPAYLALEAAPKQ